MIYSWLRKVFDAITAGEAPADVDAAAHRSALWTAFIFCCVLYVTAFVLGNTLDVLAVTALSPLLGDYTTPLFQLLSFLSLLFRIGPPSIFLSFFIPFLIYGFALRRRGRHIPFTILMLVGAVFLAYLLNYLMTGWNHLNFSDVIFFLIALVTLRLVSPERKNIVAVSALILILTLGVEIAFIHIIGYNSFREGFPDYLIYAPIFLHSIMDLIRIPVLILLPISLMAAPPPFALRNHYIDGKQLARLGRSITYTVLTLAAIYGVLGAIANAMLYNTNMPRYLYFLDLADWSILTVLFVLAVTALFMRRASKELIAFLFLVPFTVLTSRYVLMLGWLPANGALSATLLVSGLVALALTGESRWSAAKLRAAGVLTVGFVLLWLWCWLILPNYSQEFSGVYVIEASYPIISAAIARAAMLLYIPAVLFAAWWFISPKEIESLVLGKESSLPETPSERNATPTL